MWNARRQRNKKLFGAINAAIKFLHKYRFEPEAPAEDNPHTADLDEKILGTSYEAESTRACCTRTKCRHPSYAVHNVSWASFLDSSTSHPIEEKVLERQKDAWVLTNVLSAAECESLIHLSERHGYVMLMSAERGGKGRTNTRVLTHDESLAAALFERVRAFLPRTYRLSDGRLWDEEWELVGLNERFRWCKYVEGQSFKNIHCDKRVNLPKEGRHSFFTVNIYLNAHGESYEGGRTIFYDQTGWSADGKSPQYAETSAFAAQTGDVMVFNHWPQKYPHCGEMLASGTKYLLRSDVMYQRRES